MMDQKAVREYFQAQPYLSREKIHSRFGGNPKKNITTSALYPVIFLFIGSQGGDWEGWNRTDGFFHYTGDGPAGDMQLLGGNHILAEHKEYGRMLLLFEPDECGDVHCLGEFEYVDHYEKNIPDSTNNQRRGIIFRLRPVKPAEGK